MLDKTYKKLETVAKDIQRDLRSKGFVIPVENRDGSVTVDRYTIRKKRSGLYKIENAIGDTMADHINLPQSAAIIANNLALGRWVDDRILKLDKQYGYSLFEELQAKRIIDNHKDWDKVDVMQTKIEIARRRKENAKQGIITSFEKLRSMR
jgi:hypothetical protein